MIKAKTAPHWFDKLPKPFQDKIKIDEGIRRMRERGIIGFEYGKKLLQTQRNIRSQCQNLLKKKG